MATQLRHTPAEWERHEATLLAFPPDGKDWPGKYSAIKWCFIDIIKKITRYEPVILMVKSEKLMEMVGDMISRAHIDRSRVRFIIQNTNRCWMRDSGPVIVRDNRNGREALHFRFNGWAKYPNYRKDQEVPAALSSYLEIPLIPVAYKGKPVFMEGGAIDTNGCGTLITTSECLLDQRIQVRNPGFEKDDYEQIFSEYLGITNTIWLEKGIRGDDTHGHVDDICRFVSRDTVLAAREPDKRDENHFILEENLEILKNARLENGDKMNVINIPMPERNDFEDWRLPASYVNFLFANDAILVPVFNDKNDCEALGIIRDLFPERDVVGISCVDLIWGLGTLHCLSREIPA